MVLLRRWRRYKALHMGTLGPKSAIGRPPSSHKESRVVNIAGTYVRALQVRKPEPQIQPRSGIFGHALTQGQTPGSMWEAFCILLKIRGLHSAMLPLCPRRRSCEARCYTQSPVHRYYKWRIMSALAHLMQFHFSFNGLGPHKEHRFLKCHSINVAEEKQDFGNC